MQPELPSCIQFALCARESQKTLRHSYRSTGLILPLILVLVAAGTATRTPGIPSGSAGVQSETKPLPAGAVLYIRLSTPVSTTSSREGEAIQAQVVRQVFDGSQVVVPLGATVQGKIGSNSWRRFVPSAWSQPSCVEPYSSTRASS